MGDGGFSLWRIMEAGPDGYIRERYVGHFDPDGEWHSDEMARPTMPKERSEKVTDDKAKTPPIGVSEETAEKPSHRSIRQKPASVIKSANKAAKLQIAKSSGKQEAWTVKVDRQTSFRIRLTESGYAVVLTWKDSESGKWPERYCCYLSKPEWSKAKRQTLANFAGLIVGKVEQRKATEGNDAAKLDAVIVRIQSLT